MDEPIYQYVKGVGWAPSLVESCSAIIGLYRVTVYNEKPQEGDYWGHMPINSSIHKFIEEISTTSAYAYYFNQVPTALQTYRANSGWSNTAIKITLELL